MRSANRPSTLAGVTGLVLALTGAGNAAGAGQAATSTTAPPPTTASPTTASASAAPPTTAASGTVVAASASPRDPLLLRGSRGQVVEAWQRALNRWLDRQGRPLLATDGIFGPRTDAATRGFQRAAGIDVDGIVGPQTRDALAGTLDGAAPTAPFEGTVGISTAEPVGGPFSLTDVRVARHEEFDRVVLDLEGEGDPGWHVEYVDSPVREQGSAKVVPLQGDAQLRITARGMGYPADTGVPYYDGPERPPLHGTRVIEDVAVGTLFEGRQNVHVGMSEPTGYRVFPLDDPTRLVVDVLHADAG